MEDLIELREGWWWPKKDIMAWKFIRKEVNDIDEIVKYVKNKSYVIQAGGNMGMWPVKYATIFENVFTFEPDDINLYCLKKNVNSNNITVYPYAVGETTRNISMEVMLEKNRGANRVVFGGDTPMITIDELNFEGCDLLQLDVEGFEHQAVLGAIETIKKFKPVIVLELKSHGEHYGFTDDETINFVKSLGYKLETTLRADHIFLPI
jgi:FkbM family methyltransferase